MKKLAVLSVLSCLVFAGCAERIKDNYKGTTYQLSIPEKQIEILGLVFVKGKEGEGITYESLLRAAESKGGNGIANVYIDVERETTKFLFFTLSDEATYYGSALAIKYTNENIIPPVPFVQSTEGSATQAAPVKGTIPGILSTQNSEAKKEGKSSFLPF